MNLYIPLSKTASSPVPSQRVLIKIEYPKKNPISSVVYPITISSLLISTLDLEMGLVKYNLKVDFEYSPEKISAAIIVDKNGM